MPYGRDIIHMTVYWLATCTSRLHDSTYYMIQLGILVKGNK